MISLREQNSLLLTGLVHKPDETAGSYRFRVEASHAVAGAGADPGDVGTIRAAFGLDDEFGQTIGVVTVPILFRGPRLPGILELMTDLVDRSPADRARRSIEDSNRKFQISNSGAFHA